ncbi:hypothetical protein SADUNF_Sadunf10G0162000 [Salix dunnii]|uniref:Uncharacterized protein n=1 Tax=Salix dunnii TaxID=1413687 RepID=A0A835JP36_9ROSI|nr:hypothetical protein SADUNF_Sadunf10G0162000 [Salix dunnii]
MTVQKSCASKHMLRRSSPAPLLVQNPHHSPKTSPLNPFHGSLSPTSVSRLEPLLEQPPYMGGFPAGAAGEVALEAATTMENTIMFKQLHLIRRRADCHRSPVARTKERTQPDLTCQLPNPYTSSWIFAY